MYFDIYNVEVKIDRFPPSYRDDIRSSDCCYNLILHCSTHSYFHTHPYRTLLLVLLLFLSQLTPLSAPITFPITIGSSQRLD